MKKLFVCFTLFFYLSCLPEYLSAQSFESDQLENSRVKNAKAEKERLLKDLCARKGIDYHSIVNIYLRAFKSEQVVELWVQGDFESPYEKIKEYVFCERSGYLGPKRKRGDRQIPEGFYFIERFNPNSNYHLSLGINYPNPSDYELSPYSNLGGDIFIHGDCQTIGCIPITDDKIKEVYLFAVKAKNNGQHSIPVHVFPYKFDKSYPRSASNARQYDPKMDKFWTNLEGGYYYFENHKRPPFVHINEDGLYEFF